MSTLACEPARFAPAVANESSLPEAEAMRRRLVRLAYDVHDGPMQSLIAVGYGLQQLRQELMRPTAVGDAPGDLAAQIAPLLAELAAAEAGLRSLITTLERNGSAEIDTLDVIAATEIARFSRRCDAATEIIVQPDCRPDSHSQALAIGAVLREALNNIAKHARAEEVLVRLLEDQSEILLEITDNGEGFNPAATAPGIGLASMRGRLRLLDGELEVWSAPGGPTTITARFRRWQPRCLG